MIAALSKGSLMNLFRNPWAIVLLILVVVLLFGAGKLPGLARNLGQSMRIFKSEVEEMRGDDRDEDVDEDRRGGSHRVRDDRDDRDRLRDDRDRDARDRDRYRDDRDDRYRDDRDDRPRSREYDPRDEVEREPVRSQDDDSYRRD
ncbi:sec-independent protein translocase protein TatA [Brachybacterium muris]|nr:Sec-independent protein translocase subunit TatA [Brachybacterium muris]MBM7500706.1 sec-independent protein translocase protein TatA [Brachybacterium muris]